MSSLSDSIDELRGNARQWKAFNSEGHCVVVAPPGSGKTKLLAIRAAQDLATVIEPPHGAACITLTNPAADELSRRMDALGARRASTVYVGTVHAFALNRIIVPFARPAGLITGALPAVASQSERTSLMKQSIDETFSRDEDTYAVRSTIERHRKLMASDEEWQLAGSKVRAAAELYKRKLEALQLIDFDGVIDLAVTLVEQHRFVRRTLTTRYPRIYVDEYQDLAPGLDRLVRALCFDYALDCQLFAVGDPDQAIYGWTGTRPELLDDLTSRSDVEVVRLNVNYRCREEIIRRSEKLLEVDRELIGSRVGGSVVAIKEANGLSAQVATAVNHIRRLREDSDTQLHCIAVLCATHNQCGTVAQGLRNAGIPATVRNADYPSTPATMLVESLAAWAVLGRETSGQRLGTLLARWRSLLGTLSSRANSRQLVSLLLECSENMEAKASAFVTQLMALGLKEATSTGSRTDDAEAIAQLVETYLNNANRGAALSDLARRSTGAGRVQIMTTAACKSLEFDVVVALGVDEGQIPSYLSRTSAEIAEERRKFYVAITRARDSVLITYSGFTVTKYGRKNFQGPSRFLKQTGLV